jgi:predicted PurR-regulated permease PerM
MVEWLEERKLPRALVITLIISAVLGTLIGIGILIIPRLVVEVGELASNLPHWVDSSWDWGEQVFLPWVEGLNLPLEGAYSKLREHLPQMLGSFSGKLMNWSSSAISGMAGLLSGLANLILIPIITIYFLNEYNQNKSRVYSIVPMKSKELAFQLYQKFDTVLAAYIRGQLLVCSFLAIWIGLGLWLFAGLPYALLLGIAAGLANLLPYIGTSIAALLTLIVAATQPDPLVTVVKALIVFATAQFLEGNLITPRIVGNRVGLHPLVVIFSVLLFATLFGFIGLLIAIPVAASANVVVKTWINHTKLSQD